MKARGIRCKGLRGASKEADAVARELTQWTGASATFEIRGKHGSIHLLRPDGGHVFQTAALTSSDWRAEANAVCRIRRILRALGCTKLTSEVEDNLASTEAREFVPKILGLPSTPGEHDATAKAAKRAMRGILLDRSKPYWRILIDDQEAAAFQTFDECLDKSWPPNAWFEHVTEVPYPRAACCPACGGILRDHVTTDEYAEDLHSSETFAQRVAFERPQLTNSILACELPPEVGDKVSRVSRGGLADYVEAVLHLENADGENVFENENLADDLREHVVQLDASVRVDNGSSRRRFRDLKAVHLAPGLDERKQVANTEGERNGSAEAQEVPFGSTLERAEAFTHDYVAARNKGDDSRDREQESEPLVLP